MTHRQRFFATMHYQPRDRPPLYDFNYWDETLPAWHAQGLPAHYTRATVRDYFGLDCSLGGGEPPGWRSHIHCGLCPAFEHHILEDRGDLYIEMQPDGVIVQRQRSSVSIPMHIRHTLTDRESWQRHYKPRLNSAHPSRLPADWHERLSAWRNPARDYPVFLSGGSLFGWIRDWMGIEAVSMLVYDDPAFFQEMVETIADCILGTLQRALAGGADFDACGMWEDMCYSGGPLLAPEHFQRYLVPHYRRIADLLRRHNIDIIWVDCDGRIDHLLPLWLDAGINCMFPLEIGTWNADPLRYRREYGAELLLMGGFDKRILSAGPRAIETEIHRLAPLVAAGGYIPFCDHRVPPDVPLTNYLFYLEKSRQTWCREG